jgi:hypothetical protein
MPETLPTVLVGNAVTVPHYPSGQSINFAGCRYFVYEGYAEVNTTTGNVIAIRNENDQPLTLPVPLDTIAVSANDPIYLTHASFYLPRINDIDPLKARPVVAVVTSTNATDVLKLATAANADLTSISIPGAVSGASTGGTFPNGVPSGEAISIFDPLPGLKLTAGVTLQLYSSTAAGAAGVAGGNIRVSTSQGRILIPVRVEYYRKSRSPGLGDFGVSAAQRTIYDALP